MLPINDQLVDWPTSNNFKKKKKNSDIWLFYYISSTFIFQVIPLKNFKLIFIS